MLLRSTSARHRRAFRNKCDEGKVDWEVKNEQLPVQNQQLMRGDPRKEGNLLWRERGKAGKGNESPTHDSFLMEFHPGADPLIRGEFSSEYNSWVLLHSRRAGTCMTCASSVAVSAVVRSAVSLFLSPSTPAWGRSDRCMPFAPSETSERV